jgi:DNA-binding NtrC family response regulator
MATILLVDNDPYLALQRKALLERKFRDVMRVGDAAEALCLVEQPEFAVNLALVISGEHVQGIGGPAFVSELHTRMPKVPVLVLGQGNEASDDYPGGQVLLLQKPFTTEQMLAATGELLAHHQLNPA